MGILSSAPIQGYLKGKSMKKTIEAVMVPNVHTIGSEITLGKAEEMMRQFHIRHLPVLSGGKVVGVVTDRDLKLLSRFPGYHEFRVEEAMTPDPYVVSPDTSFTDVAEVMAERKIGCVIVTDHNRVVGIFTAVDAMRLMAAAYRT